MYINYTLLYVINNFISFTFLINFMKRSRIVSYMYIKCVHIPLIISLMT